MRVESYSNVLIDNLIILGRACPEPLKDGRVTVCLAGYSESLGFVRLYPTHPKMKMKRWDMVKVKVTRNDRDTRDESWKIVGSRTNWDELPEQIEVVGRLDDRTERRNLIGNLTDNSIHVLNNEKRSLGIVRPSIQKTYFAENARFGKWKQQGLPGFTDLDDYLTKRDYEVEPRVTYLSEETPPTRHDQQVLEWGFYEWFRKAPEKRDQVWENAGIGRKNTDIYFLVGNLHRHRTSFMVISVLRVPSGDVMKRMMSLRKRTPREDNESE